MKHFSFRSIFVIVLILIASTTGGYCYWSTRAWSDYENSYVSLPRVVRWDTDTALALATTSYDERSKKVASLNEMANAAMTKKSMCEAPILIKWQEEFFADSKAKLAKCNEIVDSIANYGADMHSITSYLGVEQKIASIISSTVASQKQTEKTWELQLAAWTKAIRDIDAIQTENVSQPLKEHALDYAKKTESSWRAVIAAHKAHDKTRYLKAYAELVKCHETLTKLASDSGLTFNALAQSLQSSYDTLK